MGHDGNQDGTTAPFSAGTRADDSPPILTVSEAAELLRLSRSFTYELVARGELPSVRFGRRIVIPRVAIERMLDGAERSLRPPA